MASLFNSTKSGYCRICGHYGKLSEDHIPPEKCFNEAPVYVNQPYQYKIDKGLKVRSICEKCNNDILGGLYDNELKSFVTQIDNYFRLSVEHKMYFKKTDIEIDKEKVLRGILGHLLSCYGSQEELTSEIDLEENCFSNRMRKYVLGENNQFYKEIIFLFWIHPYRSIRILPSVAMTPMYSNNLMLCGALLSFYPVGIFIINNNDYALLKGLRLNELVIDGTSKMKINIKKVLEEDFPFSLLKNNRGIMFLFNGKSLIHGMKSEFFANSSILRPGI